MEYIIKYEFDGREYENKYIPIVDFSNKSVKEIAYEASMSSIEYNQLILKNGCLRHIELFQEAQNDPVYSALTYTSSLGFVHESIDE